MTSCQTTFIVPALIVCLQMFGVMPGELIYRRQYRLQVLAHFLCAEIRVGAGPAPVLLGLGVHGHDDAKLLGDHVEEEAGHPEVVGYCNTLARSELERPLGGHGLGVDAADVHAEVYACKVVGFRDVSAVYNVSAHAAVPAGWESHSLASRKDAKDFYPSCLPCTVVPTYSDNLFTVTIFGTVYISKA